ncbi:MAG: molecular chaperone DnaK [Myxococcota bacterium]
MPDSVGPDSAGAESALAIGIDLGTTTSCICACIDGEPRILAAGRGDRILPSVVAFEPDGSTLVGKDAKEAIARDPRNTIFSAKRLIGRVFHSEEVRKAQAVCPYQINEGPNGDARVRMRGVDYSMPEISALILGEMKAIAERNLGHAITQAVITVPAYFNDIQRQATKDAGRIAGLKVLRIINEPTAAALAYGYGRDLTKKVAVYDLGGGTFDISILEIGEDIFEVLATAGDTFLGGDDFDDRLLDFLADGFVAEHGVNLRRDMAALQKLKTASEKAKVALSANDVARIDLPDLIEVDGEQRGISRTITRAEFTQMTEDLVERTIKVCEEAVQAAGLLAADLDSVILVGGPTRLPTIRKAVKEFFGIEPQCHLDPEEVVATGAAIHAASLLETAKQTFLLDVTPLSLKLGISGGLTETIIERNSPIPIEQTRVFTTLKDNQEEVTIRIYQGEDNLADENELLGEFEFSGLRPATRGEIKIEVTFEINSEGIVNVAASDPETGVTQATAVRLSSGLTEEEIRRATATQANARPPKAAAAEKAPAPGKDAHAPAADTASPGPRDRRATKTEEEGNLVPLAPDEELTSPDELDLLDGIEPGSDSREKEEEEIP